MNTIHTLDRYFALTVVGTLLLTGAALAGPSHPPVDAQARYRQDIAVCDSGQSNQPQNVCRTEARNALAEAKRGGLTEATADQYARNAVRRCVAFKDDDRTACEARVFNPSRVDGSVGAGGLLRESTIVVPAK